MSSTPAGFDQRAWRRFEQACEREKFSPRPLTHEEVSRVIAATKGESFNFDLVERILGPTLAADYRARLGM